MISREDANACLEAEAADLKDMSYEELGEFAKSHSMLHEWQRRELLLNGVTVHVDTMIGKLGRLRKRVSVELILSAADETQLPTTAGLYFERYKSGRFYPSPREEARQEALVNALPYMLVGVVVIGLLALVWHLFLRGG